VIRTRKVATIEIYEVSNSQNDELSTKLVYRVNGHSQSFIMAGGICPSEVIFGGASKALAHFVTEPLF